MYKNNYVDPIANLLENLWRRYKLLGAFLFLCFPLVLCIFGILTRFFHPSTPKFLKRFGDWIEEQLETEVKERKNND